ncbi:unnamed protein product [Ceutorhynchus assimilis]|uniref:C2H2-type domain-containing protein n=1 Tax=Ceutorhynchus assimilis TaxID=467358 RepID=A0A9N9MXR9_9CUCU|nr:unnamed protein product [Ceutorhynchus assimilis]
MDKVNYCTICKKQFKMLKNLRQHSRKFHPDKVDDLAPLKALKLKHVAKCNECNTKFIKYSGLKRHVLKFHKDKFHDLVKPKHYNYTCEQCQKHFNHIKNFKYHCKTHNTHDPDKGLMCKLCANDSKYSKISDLFEHYHETHDVAIVIESHDFANLQEFAKWKKDEESKINGLFVIAHGSDKTEGYTRTKYVCDRSGIFKSRSTGLRRRKSKKINGYCPAEMIVKIIDGKYDVTFLRTHIGHDTNQKLVETEDKSRDKSNLVGEENVACEVLVGFSDNTKQIQFLEKKENFKLKMSKIIDSLACDKELDIAMEIMAPLESTLTVFRNLMNESDMET